MADGTSTPLTPAENARLIDFARACKAAARAVVLYPESHPAITATLGRIVHITSAAALTEPLRLTVLPDSLLLDDKPAPRHDGMTIAAASLATSVASIPCSPATARSRARLAS